MEFSEADKIFKTWSKWYWPCHFILHATFISKIPESFLPYPKDTLEEALNIIAKDYHDKGNLEISRGIQGAIAYLGSYVEDEEALGQAFQTFSDPKMKEVALLYIANYKRDWIKWLDQQ